ncbi:DUF7510 family protein [Halapricum hydrolyticum]|uniref:Uncharacterized protein n=1 Tax=Halapricum hydrolyticum TaxID=2979991 RepID=A0AAE3LE41_9EURY|nr:hypothetical protein [Halapricum hydrolyticum]MCU4716905.1 hypothetical protein [Halapricum hydrolyticum]MCU4725490.1 hypothetical protein [Halapricum hydrolyticum]
MTDSTDDDPTMAFDVEVRADRTILTIEGVRDAAVIVRSEEGERIYLPPEDFDAEPGVTSPYSTSPYSTATTSDDDGEKESGSDDSRQSPYTKASDDTVSDGVTYGRSVTPQGIRIVHSEPATDVRVVR